MHLPSLFTIYITIEVIFSHLDIAFKCLITDKIAFYVDFDKPLVNF